MILISASGAPRKLFTSDHFMFGTWDKQKDDMFSTDVLGYNEI